MDKFEAFVPKFHMELIPINNLVSNQDYQRRLSQRHIDRMVANFDLNQINPVKVSRRNELNYVINGQHTIETIAMVSRSRKCPVWCMVYDDLEYSHEAKIFAEQQKYTKPLSSFEIFMANLEADSDRHIMIKEIVEQCGLRLASTGRNCRICAVSSLYEIFEKYGYEGLDRTLKLIVRTWEGEANSLTANMLRGVALILAKFGNSLHDDLFAERVGSVSAREVMRTAKERRAGSIGYAEAMVFLYNKKSKSTLSIARLYSKEEKKNGTFMLDSNSK
jgi:hypothetical protein